MKYNDIEQWTEMEDCPTEAEQITFSFQVYQRNKILYDPERFYLWLKLVKQENKPE